MDNQNYLLKINDLEVIYKTDLETVRAVNGVSLDLAEGETLGLVGETGAGKTTLALSILQLLPDRTGHITNGDILFKGRNLLALSHNEMCDIRGEKISMIFQDPMTALNPTQTVGDQIYEALMLHNHQEMFSADLHKRVDECLEMVGIPAARKKDYPHPFSGGMEPGVVIAIALCCEPELLIADEPTTALDVTIQAQVLVMMKNLRDRLKTCMILITHDLGVVAQVCDKVAVMYAGEIIESGTLQDIYEGEKHHPYTVGLFGSIPQLDSETDRLSPIEGLMPDPTALPKGCSFAPRCPHACEACQQEKPGVYEEGTHRIKCILFSGEKDETGKGGAMR